MARPDPPYLPAPDGHHWVIQLAGKWRTVDGGRCRRQTPVSRCDAEAVAELNRGRHTAAGVRVSSWWRYCPEHMYGKWIEDGVVLEWILREAKP